MAAALQLQRTAESGTEWNDTELAVPPAGIENHAFSAENSQFSELRSIFVANPELKTIIEAWPQLPLEDREKVLQLCSASKQPVKRRFADPSQQPTSFLKPRTL